MITPKTLWQYLKLDQAAAWCRKIKSRIERWKRKGELEVNGDLYFDTICYGQSLLQRSGVLRTLMMVNLLRKHNEQIAMDYLFSRDIRELVSDNGMKDIPTEAESCNFRSSVSSSPLPETHGTGCVVTLPTPSVP